MIRVRLEDAASTERPPRRGRLPATHRGLSPPVAYGPHTPAERERMLGALGIDSVEALFADIPAAVHATGLDLPEPRPSWSSATLASWRRATGSDLATFLGAGMYQHHIPAAVDAVLSRGEFMTAYTPYQPEISQGTLQSIFEFQSLIAELTGLPVVSASHYDGATATAEAALMAVRATGRSRVLISRAVHRHFIDATRTYFGRRRPHARGAADDRRGDDRPRCAGRLRWRTPNDPVAGVVLGQPNAFGVLEPMAEAAALAHAAGALFVAVVEPVSLAVLATPGEYGADIAAGEGQPLGIAPQYGGPYVGCCATTEPLIRQIPGRLVGRTTDIDGRRAWVMTLRAREQDIRRDKAASNICTNQALCALAATVYSRHARTPRTRDVAGTGAAAARRLERALADAGVPRVHSGAYLNEFAVRVPDAVARPRGLLDEGMLAGLPLARWYPDEPASPTRSWCARRSSPRTRHRALRERARRARRGGGMTPAEHRRTTGSTSARGRRHARPASVGGCRAPADARGAVRPGPGLVQGPASAGRRARRHPGRAAARHPSRLPELSEPDIVRHFTQLSRLNYSVDGGMYPLGSCTMKYNPASTSGPHASPASRAPSARARRAGAGHAPADVGAGVDARRDRGHPRGQPPARGGRPRRAHGHPRHPRVPPRARRRRAGRGHRARLVARHEPRDGLDGRFPRRHRAFGRRWRRGPRRAARGARPADGRGHADEPLHARPVRAPHRRAARRVACRGCARLHGRRQHERDPRPLPPRCRGLRRHALQPPQDVLDAARRRRAGRGPDRGRRAPRALPAGAARRPRADGTFRLERPGRAPDLDRPGARLAGQRRRARARVGIHPCAWRRRACAR